jgi:hypothetical protein
MSKPATATTRIRGVDGRQVPEVGTWEIDRHTQASSSSPAT